MGGDMDDKVKALQGLIETFIYDLAQLMAALNPPMEYLDPVAAKALRESIYPYHEMGYTLAPDFGDKGEVETEGLEKPNQRIHAKVIISDRSVPIDRFDRRLPAERRKWRLNLIISPALDRIEHVSIEPHEV
jgi:hypothetical protein